MTDHSTFPMPLRRVVYTAFDAYPGFKGAQAHIRANLRALAATGGKGTLLCLGQGGSFTDPDSGATVHTCAAAERNMLRRSEIFGRFLADRADTMYDDAPDIIHFRDIWSGIPLISHRIAGKTSFVFEVNGLPSLELPGHHPHLARSRSFVGRLRAMEDECLARSDRIITVSRRTQRYLAGRGCDEAKIAVIPNAVHAVDEGCADAAFIRDVVPENRKLIVYAGTLTSWQGLPVLLDALVHLRHRHDIALVVAASTKKGLQHLKRQIAGKGLKDRVRIMTGIAQDRVRSLYRQAHLSVAPLQRGVRNELQGCCPVKIVESMASGTPVVASDLPAVRELIDPGKDGVLFVPGSGRALAGALERLLDDRDLRDRLGSEARKTAQRVFTTAILARRLDEVYTGCVGRGT